MRMILFFIFFICACQVKDSNNIPEDLLSKTELKELLVDMHLLQAKISIWNQTTSFTQAQQDSCYRLLYEKHSISESLFDSSLFYYSTFHIETLDQIYQGVIKNLENQELELD